MVSRTSIRLFAEGLVVAVAALLITFEFMLFLGLIPVYFAFPYAMGVYTLLYWAPHLQGWLGLGIALLLALLQYTVYWIVLKRFEAKRIDRGWVMALACAHVLMACIGVYVASGVGVH
jgi:hypothetical protein